MGALVAGTRTQNLPVESPDGVRAVVAGTRTQNLTVEAPAMPMSHVTLETAILQQLA